MSLIKDVKDIEEVRLRFQFFLFSHLRPSATSADITPGKNLSADVTLRKVYADYADKRYGAKLLQFYLFSSSASICVHLRFIFFILKLTARWRYVYITNAT
jgi:hypothetical protein